MKYALAIVIALFCCSAASAQLRLTPVQGMAVPPAIDVTTGTLCLEPLGACLTGGATKWAAGTARDVYLAPDNVLCSGPAWPGLHSTQAERGIVPTLAGKVNGAAMACDDSPTTTRSCAAQACAFKGTIYNSVAGVVTVHFSPGMDRKLEIWNEYNREPISVRVISNNPYADYQWCADAGMCATKQNPEDPYYLWQGEPIHWWLAGLYKWQLWIGQPTMRARIVSGGIQPVRVAYRQGWFFDTRFGPAAFSAGVMWNADASQVITIGTQRGVFPDFNNPTPCGQTAGHNWDTAGAYGVVGGGQDTATCHIADGSGVNTIHPVVMGVRGRVIVGCTQNRPGYAPESSCELSVETQW